MTIAFTYDAPFPSLFENISGSEISSKAAFDKYGADLGNHPVGPGPYVVKDQIAGNQIVYDRGVTLGEMEQAYVDRTTARDVTLYKSLGIAPQDLASAHYVLQKARERGVGQVIDF